MSTLRSLKKPKKHRKNILIAILAVILAAGIFLGILCLSRGGKHRFAETVIKTEIVK